jgi:predicted permease
MRAVAYSDSVPPEGWGMRWSDLDIDGKPYQGEATGGTLTSRKVTPGYFAALDIPIVRGRSFTEEDVQSSQPVVMISRLLAARIFPGEDPIGRRVNEATVVGVAENVKNGGLIQPDLPEIYFLRSKSPSDWDGRRPTMVIGSVLSTKVVAPWVRSQIAGIDPIVPVQIEALDQTVNQLANRPRFETALLGFFAFCGLLMAVIGLYGVISFVATQRTQEIGIRMALGATRADTLRLIAGEGARLIVFGGLLGLGAALASAQLLKSLLFNVPPRDPLTYAAVTLLLAVVALIATLIPARAAMKVEPMIALRYE